MFCLPPEKTGHLNGTLNGKESSGVCRSINYIQLGVKFQSEFELLQILPNFGGTKAKVIVLINYSYSYTTTAKS